MTGLSATDLCHGFGTRTVLDGVSCQLEPGAMTLLAGRNGAGKSTCLAILAGILRPQSGAVRLDGVDVSQLAARQRARSISLVPQDADLSFEFSGREIVMMGRYPYFPRFGGPATEDHEAVESALAMTDSLGYADRSVRTLSGGELRRIHLARSLATRAPVILADEPTANLDLEHAVGILDLLAGLAASGRAVLVASHDINLAAPRCARALLLHEGRIRGEGAPEDVFSEAAVEAVFGVRSSGEAGYFPRRFAALD